MKIPNFFRRVFRSQNPPPDLEECPDLQHAWSLSARLAAVSDLYVLIVPSDLADLIKEAKMLHPEAAHHAVRRDAAVREWTDSAKQSESP